ncbi:hypothetical protein Bca4012_050175 [Brassica carinata]
MDLGTVKSRLSKSWYESPSEFAQDVRLTFNPVGHDVHRMAQFSLNMFEEKWAPLETQYESLNSRQQPSPLPPILVETRTLETAESMTNAVEPLALAVSLEKREEEEKTNPDLAQQDDEIELDIDSLDLQTLWELYRFVTGYKEGLSKKKEEQGLSSEREAESVHNGVQEPNTLVTGSESTKVTELGHVNAVSSSSSSGSGSSSDSDSDSSGHGS